MPFKFSSRSQQKLKTCHQDLQLIAHESLKRSDIDFGIVEGHRSLQRQQLLYQAQRSRIDGVSKKGKHNYQPSLALDIVAYVNGKISYRESYLAYLGGVFTSTARYLLEEKFIQHRLRWGGNWDGDGEIITDQSFLDMPHFELC
ncbi:MAG: hypothetical protein OXB93_03435 [Cytophagales bacterium]|nr:hypothetical protein [Cytophagales bacterium]